MTSWLDLIKNTRLWQLAILVRAMVLYVYLEQDIAYIFESFDSAKN